jgi:hypothetical protein
VNLQEINILIMGFSKVHLLIAEKLKNGCEGEGTNHVKVDHPKPTADGSYLDICESCQGTGKALSKELQTEKRLLSNRMIHEARGLCWHEKGKFIGFTEHLPPHHRVECSKCGIVLELNTFEEIIWKYPNYLGNIKDAFYLLKELTRDREAWKKWLFTDIKCDELTEEILCEAIANAWMAYKKEE